MKAKRVCVKCEAGEHDNFDNEIHITTVRDPDTGKVEFSGMLCGDHRKMYAIVGYDLAVRND